MLGRRRLRRTQKIDVSTFSIGKLIKNDKGLLHGRDVLRAILDTQQTAVYVRVNKLQILKSVLPSYDQIEEGFCEFLLDVDALIDRLTDQPSHKFVL